MRASSRAFVLALSVLAVIAACGGGDDRPPAAQESGGGRAAGDAGSAADAADGAAADGGSVACTNGLDDDGDGLVDALDPECTGPRDNDEATFGSGLVGDNSDPCKQDCFFDGNSGQGDDGCSWNLACDPLGPGTCGADAGASCGAQSDRCRETCLPGTPNGCDCFGCCSFPREDGGTVDVRLTSTCTEKNLDDPSACPRCTPVPSCFNSCETCEICAGKSALPAGCTKPTCPPGRLSCDAATPCPEGLYCLTGCCFAAVN